MKVERIEFRLTGQAGRVPAQDLERDPVLVAERLLVYLREPIEKRTAERRRLFGLCRRHVRQPIDRQSLTQPENGALLDSKRLQFARKLVERRFGRVENGGGRKKDDGRFHGLNLARANMASV